MKRIYYKVVKNSTTLIETMDFERAKEVADENGISVIFRETTESISI